MLEELRTVLDRLDHLLIKITPNIDDNIIIPQINIHNNNCDTTSKNGSVRNEDVHIGDDIDSSPAYCHHQHQIRYHHNLHHRRQHHQPS